MAGDQIEATADAMLAKLRANLGTTIDAVNAAHADEHTVEKPIPEAFFFGPRSEPPYPYVAVIPQGTTSPVDAGSRIHFRHLIAVTAWYSDWQEEALVRKLIRLQRAVRETCLANRRPGLVEGDGGYGIMFEEDDYGPVMASDRSGQVEDDGQFVTWATTVFAVAQQQDI